MAKSSADDFDPYVEWLGIVSPERPPDHYTLLGLELFESDEGAVNEACESRVAQLRTYQAGPRGKHTQELINRIVRARNCLTNPATKADYDQALRKGSNEPPELIPVDRRPDEFPDLEPKAETTTETTTDPFSIVVEESATSSTTTAIDSSAENAMESVEPGSRWPSRFVLMYAAACLVGLGMVWVGAKLLRPNPDTQADSAESAQKPAPKKEPKIVNLFEEKKGILPGKNNSFLLGPDNGKIKGNGIEVGEDQGLSCFVNWTPDGSNVVWGIWIEEPGYYEAIVSYRSMTSEPQTRIVMKTDTGFKKSIKMRQGDAEETIFKEEFVLLFRKRGSHQIEFSIDGNAGDFRMHSILLRPNRTTRE